MIRNSRILITGGLGFIGSTLAIKLVELGAKVTILDALISDYGGNQFNIQPIKDQVKIIIGDVRDQKLIKKLIKNQNIIFSLAGTLSHVDSMTDPFTDLEINCTSQLSLLEACRQFNPKAKIIFAGTRNQYGRAKYTPVDESHPMEPTDVNGINNVAAEWYYRLYHNVHQLWTCSLRLTNTYGPRHQMKHPRQGVLNWFIRQLLDGQTIKLYGDGSQIRDTNYVDDVVQAFILTAQNDSAKGQVFNLGGTPISLKKFVQKTIEILGQGKYKTIPFPSGRKAIEIGDYVADYSKIRKALNWKPKISLSAGLKKTIGYYQEHKQYYW